MPRENSIFYYYKKLYAILIQYELYIILDIIVMYHMFMKYDII